MFVVSFKRIGNARRAVQGSRRKEWLFWLLGATMFDQIMAYMGVDYFDQSKFVWYALLAIIAVATIVTQESVARKSTMALASNQTSAISIPEATDDQTLVPSSGPIMSKRWLD